ncbi:MAG: type II secretion system F family protein, partial [Patescibacteria group bacterium]
MKINNPFLSLQRVSATSKIFLLQNLAVMVKAGLPLAEALNTLAEQTGNKKLKNILNNVCAKVSEGRTFGESLGDYEHDFGELFVNMIKAGEASGQLEEVLHQLHIQTKKDHELMTKIRN